MADEQGTEGAESGAGNFDLETIRKLLTLMDEHGLAELEIEHEDMAVRLRKAGHEVPTGAPPAAAPAAAAGEAETEEEKLPTIDSPMVGTFYEASSPEADPFVRVGDRVEESTVVCIVEAMKVFNEIKAEWRGRVVAIPVENGALVQAGDPLIVLEFVDEGKEGAEA